MTAPIEVEECGPMGWGTQCRPMPLNAKIVPAQYTFMCFALAMPLGVCLRYRFFKPFLVTQPAAQLSFLDLVVLCCPICFFVCTPPRVFIHTLLRTDPLLFRRGGAHAMSTAVRVWMGWDGCLPFSLQLYK